MAYDLTDGISSEISTKKVNEYRDEHNCSMEEALKAVKDSHLYGELLDMRYRLNDYDNCSNRVILDRLLDIMMNAVKL